MKSGLSLALVILNALLAALLAWLWLSPGAGARGVHWQPPPAVKPDLGAAPEAAIGQDDADTARYMAILDRPVFSTTRRPAPVAAKGAGPDPMDGIHLYGLFSGPDGGGAIVRVDGKSRRLRVNESLGGWSLKEVRATEAVFARGGESRVVALVQARAKGTLQAAPGGSTPAAAASVSGYPVAAPPRARRTLSDLAAAAAGKPRTPFPAAAPQPAPAVRPAAPARAAPTPNKGAASGPSPFSIGGTR